MSESWHQPIWQQLVERLDADRVPHGILLSGSPTVGKAAVAERFCQALLCQDRQPGGRACGQCASCRYVAAGSHPDMHRVGLQEDARWLKIDQIRQLSRQASLTSSLGRYQVFIVNPADRLTVSAANAFLKTLEEPRADSVLILIADSIRRLPITVLSRCQRFHLPRPSTEAALEWLKRHHEGGRQEHAEALSFANGLPGRALELLQQDLLPIARATRTQLQQVAEEKVSVLQVAAQWFSDHPERRLSWMHQVLGASCRAHCGEESTLALTVGRDLASLIDMIADVERTQMLMDGNLRPELLLEGLLVRWQSNRPDKHGDRLW